jgi:lysophospholipase L1-like esterase
MQLNNLKRTTSVAALAVLIMAAIPAAWAQPWVSYYDNTRYLALGDSLSAGFEAKPVTQAFVYQLYRGNVIDNNNNLLFCTQAVPGATSADVLQHQVPQVRLFFPETGVGYRKVVTLTVGGNDLLSLLNPDGTVNLAKVPETLMNYGNNLTGILGYFATNYPDAKVYVGNLYDPKLPVPGEEMLIAAINQVTAGVVAYFPGRAALVDLFSAFQGKGGLLIVEKKKAGGFDVHPTSAGHQEMTKAFSRAIEGR